MKIAGFARAKINLSLDIVAKMSDGYHEIRTIMQSIALGDEITVECISGAGVTVTTNLPYLPGDERNIAAKAALAFYRRTGMKGYRTRIEINKHVPVCAGMGGGSADGACVLRLMDKLFGTELGFEALRELGGEIGSDVPFCISGGTALAEGRGDRLTPLPPIPECHIVICKPPFAFSTPELFGRIRCDRIHARPDTEGIVGALGEGDLKGIARRMYNVFEDALPRGKRDIEDVKYALLDSGAEGAVMTGSGSAVFGVFAGSETAQTAYKRLSAGYKECFLTKTELQS